MVVKSGESKPGTQSKLVSAMIAHKEGEYLKAIVTYRGILDREPKNADALHHYGMALYKLERETDAVRMIEASLVVDPNQPAALMNLARIFFNQGNLVRCTFLLERVLSHTPDDADALILRGHSRSRQRRYRLAANDFLVALATYPDNLELATSLATAFDKAGCTGEAIEWYSYVLERDRSARAAIQGFAFLLRRTGRSEDALKRLQAGVTASPENTELAQNHAALLEELGKFKEARTEYLSILEKDKNNALAIGSVVRMKGFDCDEKLVSRAAAMAADSKRGQFERVFLNYSLGRYYDNVGSYACAYRYYSAANKTQAATFSYDPQLLDYFVDTSIKIYDRSYFKRARKVAKSDSDTKPVFIVGMPRSGTTLTEQILSSHSRVFGCGEVNYFISGFGLWTSKGHALGRPERLSQLDDKHLTGIRAHYLTRLTEIGGTSSFLTDKMPFNFLHLGVIRRLFPDSPVIHCVRHPLDTCLSVFFENLTGDFSFATAPERLTHYYRAYWRLMEHWEHVLGDTILKYPYEMVVNDRVAASSRLLQFCGLDWEDACLDFYRSNRAVATPSNWQVRQPIYTSSLARWKKYEFCIESMSESLADVVEEYESSVMRTI